MNKSKDWMPHDPPPQKSNFNTSDWRKKALGKSSKKVNRFCLVISVPG